MRFFTANSLSQLRAGMPPQRTPFIPAKLYLDLTEDCNMSCVMCRETPGKAGRIMKKELFTRIIDETCSGVTSYSLFNFGESLLLKDFFERLDYILKKKQPDTLVDLSTNGMLLTPEKSQELIQRNVQITVSFDGASAETFESIRRGGSFSRICRHLEAAADLGSAMDPYRSPGVYVAIQRQNWRELSQIVRLVHDLGVRRLGMGPVVAPKTYSLELSSEVRAMVASALNLAKDLNLVVDIYPTSLGGYAWEGEEYIPGLRVETGCDAPFNTVSVSWNGDVLLCCNVGEFVGNLEGMSFQEIWMGQRYQELRELVNQPGMPGKCRHCPWVNRY